MKKKVFGLIFNLKSEIFYLKCFEYAVIVKKRDPCGSLFKSCSRSLIKAFLECICLVSLMTFFRIIFDKNNVMENIFIR